MVKEVSTEKLWADWERHSKAGSMKAALVDLAQLWRISQVRREQSLSEQVRVSLQKIDLPKACEQIENDLLRIQSIFSVGDDFNDDEFLLGLTVLMQADLCRDLLSEVGSVLSISQCNAISALINEHAQSSDNRRALESAQHQIRKNWPIWGINLKEQKLGSGSN